MCSLPLWERGCGGPLLGQTTAAPGPATRENLGQHPMQILTIPNKYANHTEKTTQNEKNQKMKNKEKAGPHLTAHTVAPRW